MFLISRYETPRFYELSGVSWYLGQLLLQAARE